MTDTNYLRDWIKPNYKKKCASVNKMTEKAQRMKKRFKFFEFSLVFNIGFFITALAFTILFKFNKETTIFTIYLFAVLHLNIYSYCYTKKELNRLVQKIRNNKETR